MPKSSEADASRKSLLPDSLSRYWRDTRRPVSNLIFLLPIVGVYEAGALWLRGWEFEHRLVAERILVDALDWFGGGGFWPPVAVSIGCGVLGATVLGLVLIPAAYRLLRVRQASQPNAPAVRSA